MTTQQGSIKGQPAKNAKSTPLPAKNTNTTPAASTPKTSTISSKADHEVVLFVEARVSSVYATLVASAPGLDVDLTRYYYAQSEGISG